MPLHLDEHWQRRPNVGAGHDAGLCRSRVYIETWQYFSELFVSFLCTWLTSHHRWMPKSPQSRSSSRQLAQVWLAQAPAHDLKSASRLCSSKADLVERGGGLKAFSFPIADPQL